MTDIVHFPLVDGPAGTGDMHFTCLDRLDDLPRTEGIYVLLGHHPDRGLHPLVFGHARDLAHDLPRSADFASALHEGIRGLAIARPVDGCDNAALAQALGMAHDAPLNTRRAALQAIEAARLPQRHTPLAAE